jgi:hypothetical protein
MGKCGSRSRYWQQQNCCHDRQENEYGKLEILGVGNLKV